MCIVARCEHASNGYPKCKQRSGHDTPPSNLERFRGAKDEPIEEQKRNLHDPEHHVQEAVIDGVQVSNMVVQIQDRTLRRPMLCSCGSQLDFGIGSDGICNSMSDEDC